MSPQRRLSQKAIHSHTRRPERISRATGFFVSSKAPYGYRKITVDDNGHQHGTLELDPPASETVRTFFDRLLRGMTVQAIAAELNATGTPAPTGGAWSRRHISQILRTGSIGEQLSGAVETPIPQSGRQTHSRQ